MLKFVPMCALGVEPNSRRFDIYCLKSSNCLSCAFGIAISNRPIYGTLSTGPSAAAAATRLERSMECPVDQSSYICAGPKLQKLAGCG